MAASLITSYEIDTGTTQDLTTLTTPSFTPSVGEMIVCKAGAQDASTPTIGSFSSTGGLSFTTHDSSSVASHAPAKIGTAQVSASSAMTVSCTFTGTAGQHFLVVERWSGATLDATPNLTTTKTGGPSAPSTTLTTEAGGSVVTWVCVDWDYTAGSIAYRSSATETQHYQTATGNYNWYCAYQSAATAGSQTLGMTSPTNQTWTLIGVELQSNTGPLNVVASAIATGESFGTPVVGITAADQTITAAGGIVSAQAVGSPTISVLPPDQSVTPTAIASTEAVGSPLVALAATDQTVVGVGIGSAESVGVPVVAVGNAPIVIAVATLTSAETFGVPAVTVPNPDLTVSGVGGIATTETIGLPVVSIDTAAPVVVPGNYIRDTYLIDGVDLTGYAWRIETAEGTQMGPETVGDNPRIPGRDGVVQVFGAPGQQRRPDGLGLITFNMWLMGVDATTGDVPVGSSSGEQWYERWDELVRLFYRRQVTIDHPRLDGTRRALNCYLMPGQSVAPSRVPSSPWFGRFKATFAIPAAHWVDLAPVTTGPTSLATNGFLSLGAFAGSTAPSTDVTVIFSAGNNPRLSTSYNFVGWNDVISAGRQVGIDSATGSTHQANGSAWTPGYGPLVWSPGPRYFEVDPSEPLSAVLTHTGGGLMTVEVSGKRHYRTS